MILVWSVSLSLGNKLSLIVVRSDHHKLTTMKIKQQNFTLDHQKAFSNYNVPWQCSLSIKIGLKNIFFKN